MRREREESLGGKYLLAIYYVMYVLMRDIAFY